MMPTTAATPIPESEADRHRWADVYRSRLGIHRLWLVVAPLPVVRRRRAIDGTATQERRTGGERGDCGKSASETFHDNSFQDIVIISSQILSAVFFTFDYS
jgi:hypothetical protein